MEKKRYGLAIRKLRLSMQFSQEKFAHKIGISAQNLSKIERGVTKLPNQLTRESIDHYAISAGKSPIFDKEREP